MQCDKKIPFTYVDQGRRSDLCEGEEGGEGSVRLSLTVSFCCAQDTTFLQWVQAFQAMVGICSSSGGD